MAKSIFQQSPMDAAIDDIAAEASLSLSAPKLPGLNLPDIPSPSPAPAASAPTRMTGGHVAVPAQFKGQFEAAAIKHGIPVNVLMAIGEQESRYNPAAVGTPTQWGTAKGIMQYLDSTAQGMGINPYDPVASIDAAAKQIRQRLNKGYSMADAIKEHHAGPDRQKWGVKTAAYGDEVLARAARIKGELAPEYEKRAPSGPWYSPGAKPDQGKGSPVPADSIAGVIGEMHKPGPDISLTAGLADPNSLPAIIARRDSEAQRKPDEGNLRPAGRPSVVRQFGSDVKRGVDSLANLGVGAAALGADLVGADDTADALLQRYIANEAETAERNPAIIGTYKNIETLGDAGRYAVEAIGENLPMLLPSLVSGGLGAVAARKAAERGVANFVEAQVANGVAREVAERQAAEFVTRRATMAAAAGASASSVGMESGNIYGDTFAETGKKAPGLSLAFGVPAGLLDAIEPVYALRRVAGPAVDQLAGGIIRRMGQEAGTQFLIEMGTEGLQTMLEEAPKAIESGKPYWTEELLDNVIDAGLKGGIGGGVMGAASGAMSRGNREAQPVPQDVDRAAVDALSPGDDNSIAAGARQTMPEIVQEAAAPVEPVAPPPPPPAPPAPAGPIGRAMERAPMPAGIDVPLPVDPGTEQQPLTLVTGGVEYPVRLVGRTPDAVWVRTDGGEELQIPNADIDAGNVQLVDPIAAQEATPPVVKDDLTTEPAATGNENLQVEATAPATVEDSSQVGAPGQASVTEDLTVPPRSSAAPVIVETVDPSTGEITEAPAKAANAPAPRMDPSSSLDGMSETDLRMRLKYLREQSRTNAGWSKPLLTEKKRVEAALDALTGLAAPAATIEQAEAQAATSPLNALPEPTDAQKEAGNYKKGHVNVGGLDVSIENPAGTSRRPEWPPLKHTYGYVKRSEGADGDHVDVFLGPKAADPANPVFIVDQVNEDGSFDEHKVMVGFGDIGAARRGYHANYAKGWQGMGDITEMSFADFKDWVKDPARTNAPAGQRVASPNSGQPIGQPGLNEGEPPAQTPPPATTPAAPPTQRKRAFVPRRETDKKHQNPFVRNGERYSFTQDVDYIRAGDTFEVESAGKRSAYFRNVARDSGTSLNNFNIERAIADGVMSRVSEETPLKAPRTKPAAKAEPTSQPPQRQDYAEYNDSAENAVGRVVVDAMNGEAARADALKAIGDAVESGAVLPGFASVQLQRIGADRVEAQAILNRAPVDRSEETPVERQRRERAERRAQKETPPAEPTPPAGDAFANNKLFTADKVEAARARIRDKMNRLNSGIDPELLTDGMVIAAAYIESGVRQFAAYARAMRDDFGPRITPYLLSFWEGARNYPGLDTAGMTPTEESRAAHGALLAEGLPAEEAIALGTEVAAPKAKKLPKTPAGARTLRSDWGVDVIDGWTKLPSGKNTETDFGLKDGMKDAFLSDAVAYLRAVASTLAPMGFEPHVSAKGKAENPVSRNAGGVAVSGDVSLHLRHADTGANVYVTIGGTSLRGVVPHNGAGVALMYRVSPKEGDKQAHSGINRWAPIDLTAVDLADTIAWEANRNQPELTRDHVQPASSTDQRGGSRVPGVAGGRVSAVEGRRESDPQSGNPRMDIVPMGAGQPEDVGETATARPDRQDGVLLPAADVADAGRAAASGLPDNGRARGGGTRDADAGAGDRGAGRQRSAVRVAGRAAESEGSLPRADGATERPGRAGTDADRLTAEPDLFPATGKSESAPVDPATIAPALPTTPSPARSGPGNFLIANPLEIVGGGPVARFDRNRQAIETYMSIRDEGRAATAEEQRTLAGYTGWGSFGQELFQGTWGRSMAKDGWQARDTWLRDHLGKDEWESAQRSITNAHYTDPPTVMAMWAMMKRMGFTGGRVLEPSMGIGNFFGMMPADIAGRSQLAGIELDSLTGGMAQLLYPDANVRVMPYQESRTPDGFYDAVIGNWPFENTVIADRRYDRLSPFLHDYFFLKAVDQVRAGGIVMGITSSGTMDKKATGIRRDLAKKAELVAAFRLPSGAFAEYAGTKVVTDIIILRKRAEPISLADNEGWVNAVPYQTPNGEVTLNEYYVANPTNVIGTIDFGHGTTRGRPGMIVHRPDDMHEQLQRIMRAVPEGAYKADTRTQHISYVANHTADREGALVKTDKGLFVVRGEQLAPAGQVATFAVKEEKKTAERVNQIERLIDMRRKYAALIEAERAGKPAAARKALKADYDAFTRIHGPLSDSYGLAYLSKVGDPFHADLAALEIDGKPAAILSRSTMRAAPSIDNPSIAEAFVLARNSAVNPSLEDIAARAKVEPSAAKAALLESGAVFELPNGDIAPSDVYLSGNVREKLRQAKAAMADGVPGMQRNIDALSEVVPADIPYFKIETQLGATWVSPAIYGEFVGHMLGIPDAKGIEVRYNGGRWTVRIDDRAKARPEARTGFGTGEYPFSRLVNAAFSNQSVTIRRRDSEGTQYVDHAATEEVNGKISEMRTKFAEWLWSDPERRVTVEAEYNEVRNAFATPRFDGSFLRFEGMALSLGNGPFDLRQHQADAIWRALVSRRSLNAHEVGTGKTFTMGGIAVESRRYGIARKPLILAHNANSQSVASEIQTMYPAAKLLYIDNMSPATIDVKMRQIANDDWDAIVVPHSLIDRFAFREDTLMDMAREEIAALEEEAYLAADEDGVKIEDGMWDDADALKKLRSPTAKELVKMRQRIIESIRKQANRASREGAISFEELGIDMVMVDEAHEFKKPPISTRMKMKGLNTQTSDRSIALSFLTRYVRGQNAGGNVHLFTGTPVTNTLTEVFHMMRYIMQDEMQAAGVDQWDGWFGSFAREVMDVEQNAAAEYEAVTRLAGFINVPELRRMIGQYMDVVFADDMPEMQPRRTRSGKTMADELTEAERAELLNGRTEGAKDRPYKKIINVTSDLTPQQKIIFEQLRGYARSWRSMTGKERRDAMASGAPESPIVTEGLAAKASFDVRLYDGEALAGQEGRAADDDGSKASRVVANVKEIYDSHPMATQVIFAEQGMSNRATRSMGRDADGNRKTRTFANFSTVRDIVERLVAQGIPREQIAIVDGGTSKGDRDKIAKRMNAAKTRVVIGSTATLGVGVNMQKNLRAMHHMDAPWMPGDLEQRNGRGRRQANQWNTVLEYRYLTDRLDGRRWQVLAIKQRFITSFLKANDETRVIEGEAAADEQSDILQSFAEAAGDPRILIREKLRKQLDGAQRRERLHVQGVANALSSARRLTDRANAVEQEVAAIDQAGTSDKVGKLVADNAGKAFSVTIDGTAFEKRKDADEAIQSFAARNLKVGDNPRVVGKFGDHNLRLGWPAFEQRPTLSLVIDGREFEGGTMQGLEQSLRKFGPDVAGKRDFIAESRASVERMQAMAAEPFHMAADLERYEKALDALELDIKANPVPPPAWLRAGAPVDTDVMWNGKAFSVTGHRWTADGWFVLADDATGSVVIPYADAKDAQGINVYEERPFEAPEVIEAKADATKGEAADSPVAHSIGGLTGGGFTSADALRTHLTETDLGDAIAALIDAGGIVLHDSASSRSGPGMVQGSATADGRVHLNADALTSRTALPVLLHEMFHSGVRPLIGDRAWDATLARLGDLYANAANRAATGERANSDFWAKALERVDLAQVPASQAVEEFAAYAIEHQASAPAGVQALLDRLAGAFKAWMLRRFGRQVGKVTPAQLLSLSRAALRSQSLGARIDPATSRDASPATEVHENVADIMTQLASYDDMFQYPKSVALTLEGTFAEILPTARPVHVITDEAAEADGPFEGILKEMTPADRVHVFETSEAHRIFVAEDAENVWIDVSRMVPGEGGNAVYMAVADYALNTGRIFIGDPNGLSDIALRRRTDLMLSSALKHGTTDHLAPHQRQIDGDKALGVPPLRWKDGDYYGNVRSLIGVSIDNLAHYYPAVKRLRFDFETGTFRSPQGKPLPDAFMDRAGVLARRSGAVGAGRATIQRGVFLQSLNGSSVATRSRLFHQSLLEQAQHLQKPLTDTFYSRVVPSAEQIDAATPGFISNLVTKAMDGSFSVLGSVPLRPLLSEMGANIPAAQEYLGLKLQMDTTRDQWHARADEVAQPWLKFRMLHSADNAKLMDLMHEATIAGTDPSKPFQSALTKVDHQILDGGPGTDTYDAAYAKAQNDRTRETAHGRLTPLYDALPAEGKRLFNQVRDTYRQLSAAFEAALLDNLSKALDVKLAQAQRAFDMEAMRVLDSGMTKEAADKAIAAAERELLKAKQLQGWAKGARMTRLRHFFETNNLSGPYFPLARFGNFFVTVRDSNDQVISFSRFEKPAEQAAFAKEMKAAGHDVQIGVLEDGGALKSQVDARFVADVESILEGADVSDTVRDAVWQRWLETMPDMSVRTNRIHRKGRAGFSSDALRAFGHHMFHGSHQLARLKFALDMDEAIALARDQAKTMPNPVRAGLLVNEMARRHQFIMNPTGGPLAQTVTSAAFVWFLAASPAAAMVNTSQTAVLGVPILAAYHGNPATGAARAAKELARALKDFAAGRGHVAEAKRLTDDERKAMDAAYENGVIERTQSHDLAGVGETGVAYSPVRTKIMATISWAFHHTERLNREVTYLAAYRMARAKNEPHGMAVDRAAELTWKIHFDYQNTSRPRAMQGDTAKMLFVFRNFNVNMLWRLFRDVHQAVKGGNRQARREAITQLAGTTGMMMLSAGIRGTWLYGIAMVMASMLFGDDAEDEFTNAIIATLGRRLGGMALNGVPGDTLGIDLSNRIGMPDLWFRSPDRELEGQQEFDYWAIQFLGAGVGSLRNMWTGVSMIADGNVERGAENLMPKFAKDLMRATRYMTEGARTLKGDPIMEDMPPAAAIKQALGFTPAELAERYEINRGMKNREQRILDDKKQILADFDRALQQDASTDTIEARMQAFNERYPEEAITVRSLRASIKSRERMRERNIGGVSIAPRLAERLRSEAPPLLYSDNEE